MQSPTISPFQTQHFPLELSPNAPCDVKTVVSAEHTIPAMLAPNRWRSAKKAVSSARLDRMEGIAIPAAFAPSLPGSIERNSTCTEIRTSFVPYGIFLWREKYIQCDLALVYSVRAYRAELRRSLTFSQRPRRT